MNTEQLIRDVKNARIIYIYVPSMTAYVRVLKGAFINQLSDNPEHGGYVGSITVTSNDEYGLFLDQS